MATITMETAARLWKCHREIEIAKKLVADLEEKLRDGEDPTPLDAFGRPRPYSLGVYTSDNSQRLYEVEPRLAKSIMRAHIAEKQRELVAASEQARIELDTIDG